MLTFGNSLSARSDLPPWSAALRIDLKFCEYILALIVGSLSKTGSFFPTPGLMIVLSKHIPVL